MKLNNNDDSHNSGLNLLIYNMLLDIESHPTWVCGLKHSVVRVFDWVTKVTPYVGVWIETFKSWKQCDERAVTPYVGVWIETTITSSFAASTIVTPYVGVWIETSMAQYSAISKMVTPCVGIYGLEHCSLVGQVYGRTVSIRPLMYFSPGFWFCYDWKKHVQARMLIFCLFFFVVSPRWQYIGT